MELVNYYKQMLEQSISTILTTTTDTMIGSPRMTLCSAPTLITGDYKLVAEEIMRHENETVDAIADNSEARGGFKLVAAASGSGDDCCPPVVDSSTWLTVVGGMAVVVWFLRGAITANVMGRRKRNSDNKVGLLLKGLEEFEENVEEEPELGRESWLLSIINEISDIKQSVDDETKNPETETDGRRTDRNNEEERTQNRCRAKVWRCMSGVMEEAVKYVDRSHGLWSLVQSALTKMVFHGHRNNMWSSLMTLPQARSLTQCMKTHDRCVAEDIIAKAAQGEAKGRYSVNSDWMEGLSESDSDEF